MEMQWQIKVIFKYRAEWQCTTNNNSYSNLNPTVSSNSNCSITYFLTGPNREADRRASTKIIKLMYNEFPDVFSGKGCFKGAFS